MKLLFFLFILNLIWITYDPIFKNKEDNYRRFLNKLER